MKVILNECYGGFQFSDPFARHIANLLGYKCQGTMFVTPDGEYLTHGDLRTDEIVIAELEKWQKRGKIVDAYLSKLVVHDVEGSFFVDEYDGYETLKDASPVIDTRLFGFKNEEQSFNLYVWKDVFCDWTCGMAFAIAPNVDEARDVICEKHVLPELCRKELSFEPLVFTFREKVGFSISGGG